MDREDHKLGPSGFGLLLRRLRIAAGLSQEALAERARMSTTGISALERGYRRVPQRETVALLTDALALGTQERKALEAAAVRPARLRRTLFLRPQNDSDALPLPLSSFIGRNDELRELSNLLDKHRLVTVVGAGGIGKTQTALHVAGARSSSERPVLLVELAQISDPERVANAIAGALGVRESPGQPPLDTVVAYLKGRMLTILLDNCEHLLTPAAASADAILRSCPAVSILATSREPLRLAGEQTFRLPPLRFASKALAESISAKEAMEYDAIRLFVERALAVNNSFAITDQYAPAIAAICSSIDGIPLAIELAAGRTNLLSPPGLAKSLREGIGVLAKGDRTAASRQRTMRSAIDWSYALLSQKEQRVFDRLSVFVGGWTFNLANAVCSDKPESETETLDILSSLLDKSLIVAHLEAREPRYSLLETVRQYGRERLEQRGELDDIARAHAAAYLELAERMRAAQREGHPYADEEVQAELDNWRAAADWAIGARKDVALGRRLVGQLGFVWRRYALVEGQRRVRASLALADEATPPDTVAMLCLAAANLSYEVNEVGAALDMARRALTLYQRMNDPLGIARAKSFIGQCLVFLGEYDEADGMLATAADAAKELDHPMLHAGILESIAWLRAMNDNISEARQNFHDALLVYKKANAANAAAGVLLNAAEAEFFAGNVDSAVKLAGEALGSFRSQNDEYSVTNVLGNLSAYSIAAAEWDDAELYAREALSLARQLNLEIHAAWALQHIACVVALAAAAGTSREDYERAAQILGFVTARYTSLAIKNSPSEEREHVRILSHLEDVLGSNDLARLMSVGQTLSFEEAVAAAVPPVLPP
ncbi:MAG: helix-turn-helix domain-containing protein [Candidatus Cybelea sp.]